MPLNPYIQIEQPNSQQQSNDSALLAQLLQMPQYTQYHSGGVGNNGMQNQLAKALRGNNSYNPNSFGGSTSNDLSAYMPWNQSATASTYGTDPYSQQSLMLAQQDAGMNGNPWISNLNMDNLGNMFDGWGSSIGDFFSGIGDWFGSSAAPAIGESGAEIAPAAEEAAPAAAAAA
jgi:hypothetical protein